MPVIYFIHYWSVTVALPDGIRDLLVTVDIVAGD